MEREYARQRNNPSGELRLRTEKVYNQYYFCKAISGLLSQKIEDDL